MHRWIAGVLGVGLGVGLLAGSLGAQAVPPVPLQPEGVAPRDARDAGFAAWREAGASGIVVAPFIATGSRYRVLVQSAVAREREGAAESLARAVVACGSELGLNDATQRRVVAERAWQPFDALVEGRPLVALTIVPRQARPIPCRDPDADELTLEFAIGLGRDTLSHPDRDATAVEVTVGGETVQPVLVGRALVSKLAPGGYAGPDGNHALRIYLDFDALAPQGSAAPTVEVRVWNRADSLPEVIALPAELTDELRRELLPWRVRRLTTAGAATAALPVPLPEPRDATLREAYRSYLAGAYADASLAALARVSAKRIRREDRATARLQVGITLAALGDAAAARTLMRDALTDDRCAWLPPDVGASIRSAMDAVTTDAAPPRCTAVSTARIVTYGFVPGLAQRRLEPDRRAAGLYPVLATASSIALWTLFSARADDIYEEYLDAFLTPEDSYRRAQGARNIANGAAVAVWVAWGGSVLHAVVRERRFERRLEAWDAVNAPATRRASVGPSRSGVGLAIHFF
jgi:hypothetical protein